MYLDNDNMIRLSHISEDYELTKNYFRTKDSILFFTEADNDNVLRKFLYKDRIKNNKQILNTYQNVKANNQFIKYTFLRPDMYKNRNVFVDLSYYHSTFLARNFFTFHKGMNLYYDLIDRLIKEGNFGKYKKKTIFINISEYIPETGDIDDFRKNINPISLIKYLIIYNPEKLKKNWSDYTIVFCGKLGYFKMDLSDPNIDLNRVKFTTLINKLINQEPIVDNDIKKDSTKAITMNIINKIENTQNIQIKSLTGETKSTTKDELEEKIKSSKNQLKNNTTKQQDSDTSTTNEKTEADKRKENMIKNIKNAAETSNTTEEALDKLNTDEFKAILTSIAEDEVEKKKMSATRAARINNINTKFENKKIQNKTVKELLDDSKKETTLKEKPIKIDSINEDWEKIKFTSFNEIYNIDEDIVNILKFFGTRSNPVGVLDIEKNDTSTSEDLKYTYVVHMEDSNGKRFKIKFDIPKLRDSRFMRIGGNEKTISGQLVLLPIIKTDTSAVQIVTNYNKVFIYIFGNNKGKSYPVMGKIIKALEKYNGNTIKLYAGDNSRICKKYNLPIDYIDIATLYNKITIKDYIIYFNQDELRSKYKVDDTKGLPFAVKNNNEIIYYNSSFNTFSDALLSIVYENDDLFKTLYSDATLSKKYAYTEASILNTRIPLIVVMSYSEGLFSALDKSNIKYELTEKRPSNKNGTNLNFDYIKFKDGYLIYELNYYSSLLMNGLKVCDTENYSIKELNSRNMWIDFLDLFGGRIKADGLDNFYDLLIDPITAEICEHYKLPTDYVEVLAYGNMLLCDNKYNKHSDIYGNRYRCNELIAGYLYKALAKSYGDYSNMLKRSKKDAVMSIKQSQVIDLLMADPTAGDLSIFSPLLEVEAKNSVSFKGLSGMNSDRSYGLDKRDYDESMVNKLAISTGFAGNVALTRQTTINMNIESKRGYVEESDQDKMSDTNTLCMTEAITPFGVTRDDSFRTAMTFIQTSKHGMRTKVSTPLLVTNGADEALGYMCSDMYAFKAKENGKVTEVTEDYMIISYEDNTKDFVDLRENVKKNSDGGFFLTIKLDTDLKVGSKVKKGDIVAYDKLSFSNKIGDNNSVSYNLGVLSKVAILTTDEGYEDSAIISEWLSKAMSSEVVVQIPVVLDKKTNVYDMVKKGQSIQEGEPLISFQNAFDEDDMNVLMKNIADDEDSISELGRIFKKSKVTGTVQDIIIYRTVDKDELSPSLKNIVNKYESSVNKIKKVADKSINDMTSFGPTETLEPNGKLKNVKDAVMIEFYLKYQDDMSIGDKLVYYSALKGVVKDIFPEGKEPKSEYRPDERIDSFLAAGSINGRMVGSIITIGCINKLMIELDRHVKDIMGIEYDMEINDQP